MERWIKHYSSGHSILLVGEGDFSFSYCLAMAFGSARNIVATTLDSYDGLITKYKNASAYVAALESMGATLLFRVDATQMKTHPYFWTKGFHRIIYNFPHAGFYGKEDNPVMISMHRVLVRGFLENASRMLLADGEIHINHKTTAPFDRWRIEDLGADFSLLCTEQDKFNSEDYPWYCNKRGAGSRCDEPFPLGACTTFKFKLQQNPSKRRKLNYTIPFAPPSVSPFASYNSNPWYFEGRALHSFDGARDGFGRTSDEVYRLVEESMRIRFRYMGRGGAMDTGSIGNIWNPPF